MVGVSALAGEYEDAQKLLAAQKWAEALPILKKLNEEEPGSVTIALALSQDLLRLNRREESLELLRNYNLNRQADIAARSFISKESFRFYQQGLDWLTKHSYPQACERLERALEKDQGHLDILLRLGECEILDGNADSSLRLFDQLERIHGKTPETQLWRARALALRGRNDEAIANFSALGATGKTPEPTAELIPLWWSEALLASNQKGAALSVLEADVKKNPKHLQTGLALLRHRFAQAESPNQYLAIDRDLGEWEKLLTARRKEKPRQGREFVFDPLDLDALQRSALDTKQQLKAILPSPIPSSSVSPTPARTSKR